MKFGLVLEGGGMRGFYTIGVLDALQDRGIRPDYVIGASAGACNAVSFLSGQRGRNLRVQQRFLADPRYVGLHSLLETGSMFGMDFIFDEIPNRLEPFDYEAFARDETEFVIVTTDVETGKPAYFGKEELDAQNRVLRASSAIPCFSPVVHLGAGQYLDGGTSDPIPVEKALADGCDRLLVVLTRDRGYEKQPEPLPALYQRLYRDHPGLVDTIARRHERYNATLARLRELERDGCALVLAPRERVKISRFERSMDKLQPLYKAGMLDTTLLLPQLESWPGIHLK